MGYNKIVLYGNQICDYLYIQNSDENLNSFQKVDSEPKEWANDTVLFSNFNNNLVAGNSVLIGDLKQYQLRRRKGADLHTEYVTTLNNDVQHIIDYMVANNTPYTYYLYPISSTSKGGATLTPAVSKEITPKWNYWSLLVVDETDEENVYYLSKMFKFELNISTGDMNNNTPISVIQNFTKFPTVQYGTANYWSGSLTSLCGYISCDDVKYVETIDMIKELKALTTDTRKKFLKDMDGNVWEVKIISPIGITTDDKTLERVKTVNISWAEVGEVSGVSVINNPYTRSTSWLLTRDGYAAPYIDYVWDNNAIWDNSKIWTAKGSALDVDLTNVGRDLYREEDKV